MHFKKIGKAIRLATLAAGLATTAFAQVGPYNFFSENPAPNKGDVMQGIQYDLDFTKISINPAINYSTFPNPKAPQNIVKFSPQFFFSNIAPGACYEINSAGPAGSDLILSVMNQAGNWVWLADDNAGGGQFRARLFIKPGAQQVIRISEYASPNNNNQNGIIIRKLNLDPGAAITAISCRQAGTPFWQRDLNLGNPFNPS